MGQKITMQAGIARICNTWTSILELMKRDIPQKAFPKNGVSCATWIDNMAGIGSGGSSEENDRSSQMLIAERGTNGEIVGEAETEVGNYSIEVRRDKSVNQSKLVSFV